MLKILSVVGELTNKIFPKKAETAISSLTDSQLDDIAEVAYAAVTALQIQHDGVPRASWAELSKVEKEIAKVAVKTVLRNPYVAPDVLHERWVTRKRDEGWTYGEQKDIKSRKHPELLPYKLLPRNKQRSDLLFYVVIHTLFCSY